MFGCDYLPGGRYIDAAQIPFGPDDRAGMAIYVAAPADIVSGGPESLHQFVHKANELGYDASIFYYGPNSQDATVPEAYRHYHTPIARTLPDNSRSLIVVAEVMAPAYEQFELAQTVIWWLSVDNFHASAAGAPAVFGRGGWDRVFEARPRLTHVTHSEYARLFLQGHGIDASMLGDYLSEPLLAASRNPSGEPRVRRVLYNPRKGREFTQALIDASADRFEWVPIQGLTAGGAGQLLATSALYVDFGEHPGQDHLPKEAAMAGCCVLTGTRGAAGNALDIPIRREFKLNEAALDAIPRAVNCIEFLLDNFDAMTVEFDPYREWIASHEALFTHQLAELLERLEIDKPKPRSARRQKVSR